jgi:hypothetical protein
MSRVTDIILATRYEETAAVDCLQEALGGFALIQVDDRAGGDKIMQCDVYLAAVNHLDIENFVAAFKTAPWKDPDCVQLMLKDEEDLLFTVYAIE